MYRGRNRRLAHERHTNNKTMTSKMGRVSSKLIFLMKIFVNELKEELKLTNDIFDNERQICK